MGTGEVANYPFTFKVFQAADIYVQHTTTDLVDTKLTLNSDYTVSLNADQDTNPGGSVTLSANLSNGNQLVITSNVSVLQSLKLTNAGGFYPDTLNNLHDKLVVISQELTRDKNRSLLSPLGENPPTFPRQVSRSGKLLTFDDEGNFDTSRSLASFDTAVSNAITSAGDASVAATQAGQSATDASGHLNDTVYYYNQTATLYQQIPTTTTQALNEITSAVYGDATGALAVIGSTRQTSIDAVTSARDSALTSVTGQQTTSIAAVSGARDNALGAVQTAQANALASVATSVNAAASSATQAQAALESIQPLPDRVSALENPTNVTGFAAAPAVAEVGSSVTPTLSWAANQNPASQSIDQGVGALVVAARSANAHAAVSASTTWTLTYSNGYTTKTATASTVFQLKRYHGVTAKAPGTALTNAEVLALANEFAAARAFTGTFDCTGGQYPVICYPATFGDPASITVGGFNSTDFTVDTLNVTNASGHVDSYHVLRLNTLQNGNAIGVSI